MISRKAELVKVFERGYERRERREVSVVWKMALDEGTEDREWVVMSCMQTEREF